MVGKGPKGSSWLESSLLDPAIGIGGGPPVVEAVVTSGESGWPESKLAPGTEDVVERDFPLEEEPPLGVSGPENKQSKETITTYASDWDKLSWKKQHGILTIWRKIENHFRCFFSRHYGMRMTSTKKQRKSGNSGFCLFDYLAPFSQAKQSQSHHS